jgi:bifunctional UDP-N-acetylglucosamine pyrophosphorylase/glucosamine-1-phosphate N-acetyltransferase
MLHYPLDLVSSQMVKPLVVVVGHQAQEVKDACQGWEVEFVHQSEQKGTGHAVACTQEVLADFSGSVLILPADVPLLKPSALQAFMRGHEERRAEVSFMWSRLEEPSGYGRVVRGATGFAIVEDQDASTEQKLLKEINVGLYLVQAGYLFEALGEIGCDNAQGEYYLPDIVNLARHKGAEAHAFEVFDTEGALGVNDRAQLAQAEARLRKAKVTDLMRSGVTCQDPAATYLDYEVEVGADTFLGAGVHLLGRTRVGRGVIIEPNSFLRDVTLGDGVRVRAGTRLEGIGVDPGTTVGD